MDYEEYLQELNKIRKNTKKYKKERDRKIKKALFWARVKFFLVKGVKK